MKSRRRLSSASLRLGVRAPLLELPALVDADRFPGLIGRQSAFQHGQGGDQRAADRHQRRQARQPERIERGYCVRQALDRRSRLRHMDDPGGRGEIHVVSPPRPAEQSVPRLLLALDQRLAALRRGSRQGRPRHIWPGLRQMQQRRARSGRSRHWRGRSAALRADRRRPRPNSTLRRWRGRGPRSARSAAPSTACALAAHRAARPSRRPRQPLRPSSRSASCAGRILAIPLLLEQSRSEHGIDRAEDDQDRANLRPAAFAQQIGEGDGKAERERSGARTAARP